jgi:hypothetical protein
MVNLDSLVRDEEQALYLLSLINKGILTGSPSNIVLATLINTWPKKEPTGFR